MPLFPDLLPWSLGDILLPSHLQEVLTKIQSFFNTTKIDGLNIQNNGIPLSKLVKQYSLFCIDFTIVQPGVGNTLTLGDYQAYATNLVSTKLPVAAQIVAVTSHSPLPMLSAKVQLYSGVAGSEVPIPGTELAVGNPVANSKVVVGGALLANTLIHARTSGLLNIAEPPFYYKAWALALHQEP